MELTTRLKRLSVLLRLSVVLHRGRTSDPLPHISLNARDNELTLTFPGDWLGRHPLTQLDLAQEASYLKAIDHSLTVAG
jgi:exopolyphosphatase/guanosine-5'-triphosphate,3'-diphosphate pyrophosphatase